MSEPVSPSPVDLLVACPHLGPGGAQRVVSLLTAEWAARGRRVAVVTLFDKPAVFELHPDVPCLGASRGPASERPELRLRTAIRALVQSRNPALYARQLELKQVVRDGLTERWDHTPAGRAIASWRGRRAARRSVDIRARKLAGLVEQSGARHLLAFGASTSVIAIMALDRIDRPVQLVISERNDPSRQELPYPYQELRRSLFGQADVLTANSRGAVEVLSGWVGAERVHFVPNPVEVADRPDGRSRSSSAERGTLLSVGRLTPQKGLEVALAALAQVPAGWSLQVVGDGPERERLAGVAVELGLADRVEWCGWQSDIAPFYAAADVFLLPSLHEGMPNALLEAMCAGVPAVATRSAGAAADMLADGGGLLVPAGDAAAFAAAVAALAADPADRRRRGEAARARVASQSVGAVLEQWDRLIGW